MPHKFNAARRHKFDKAQYRVINWAEYNESLRQRGDLTIWVSDEAQSVWSAPRRTSRGGQRRYSDLAIETCLMLRTAYRLGLRQTQGLMGSIDNTLCKPARKYRMGPVGGGPTHSRVVLEGRTSIDALYKVHHDLAELASVRIAGLSGEEIWPGLT